MSAAVDSTIVVNSESDEEFVPSPPKRGRGRPKRNRRAAANAARSRRPQPTRASAARSRRQQPTRLNGRGNHSVITVGDIDTDEDDAPVSLDSPCPLAASSSSISVRAPSPIGIDTLAQALGVSVTDRSPLKTSVTLSSLDSPMSKDIPIVSGAESTISHLDHLSQADATLAGSGSENVSTYESQSQSVCAPSQQENGTENSVSSFESQSQSVCAPSQQEVESVSVNSAPAPAPKKPSRRGLAKRLAGLSTTALGDFNTDLPDTAVYSQRVPSAMAAVLLQGKAQPEVQDFSSTSETQSDGETKATESDVIKPVAAGSIKSSTDLKKVIVKDKEESEDEPEMIVDDKDDSLVTIRSPTPPPQMRSKRKLTASRKKMNQKLSNALQTINNVKGKLDKLGQTTPKRKTRGRQPDVMIVDEEEGIIKKDMVVKVRYLSTVHRITMNLDEPLHSLAGQLSRLVGDVAEHELSLFLGDQVLDLSVTLRSANLSVADILDCHQIKTSGVSGSSGRDEDSVNLVVQCLHSRTKTTITTHKREPLKCVIEKYAEQMGVDASTLRLVFDGEDVDPRDTPGKLDMEDLDVVDVIMTR